MKRDYYEILEIQKTATAAEIKKAYRKQTLKYVAYAKPGTESVYNIRIMDEHQTVIALGAGGISKRYYPETDSLVRIPNVSNYREYINRIDEMCDRKEKKLWSI